MSEWQPIETCEPRKHDDPNKKVLFFFAEDGRQIIGHIVSKKDAYTRGIYVCDLDLGDFSASAFLPADYSPTHWMPLPTPPSTKE